MRKRPARCEAPAGSARSFWGAREILIATYRMKLVTVATHSEDYFPVLQDGSARLGYDLVVLGWGQRWRGFAWRWSLLKSYLTSVPPDELIVWCDAYDVIPIAPRATLEQRFRDFGKPMVMSVESPSVSVAEAYLRRRMFGKQCRPGVFVNGGLYMGTAAILLEMIRVLEAEVGFGEADDDQRLLNKLCRTPFMRHVAFDTESRIFFNVHRPADVKMATTRDTCFIHGPGHKDLRDVAALYGYTPPEKHSNFTAGYIRRWSKQFVPVLYPEFIASALLVGLLVYVISRRFQKK